MKRQRHWAEKNHPAIILLLLFALSTAPAFSKSEWVFDTLHTGTGSYRYYITEDAIRLDNIGNGGISVAAAPSWKVSCFRSSEKLEFIKELHDFDSSSITSLIPKHRDIVPITPKLLQKESLKGLPCNKYELPDGAMYWTPAELKTAPQAIEMITRYFNSASIAAVPIRILKAPVNMSPAEKQLDAERRKKSAVPWLNFKNLKANQNQRLAVEFIGWKKVPYKASDFEYPKGYKRTKDLKDVIISASYRNDLIDMAKDFTSDIDKKDQKKNSGAK